MLFQRLPSKAPVMDPTAEPRPHIPGTIDLDKLQVNGERALLAAGAVATTMAVGYVADRLADVLHVGGAE